MYQEPPSPRTTDPVHVARSSNAGSVLGARASLTTCQVVRSVETACPTRVFQCRRPGSPVRGALRKNTWYSVSVSTSQKSQLQWVARDSTIRHAIAEESS